MRSHDYAAVLPFLSDIEVVASTIVAICTAITGVVALARAIRSNQRTVRANSLKIGWQVDSGPDATGALVLNESNTTFQKLVVTVTCGARLRTARKDIAVLKAGDEHLWPSGDVHRSVPAEPSPADASARHHGTPHDVQITFRDGKGYWSRNDERLDRVRSLVVWAERTRARTLAKYFGSSSPFRRTYAVSVKVESFDRTEALEEAFTRLVATGRPPRGYHVPDVVAGPHDWIGRVVREGSVLEPPFSPAGLARISPVAVAALTSQEQLYAIPYVFDSVALIRNNALTGGGPMPTTFDEAVHAGAAAVEAKGIEDGTGVALQVGSPDPAGNAGDPYHMWPLFSSCGGTFFGLGGTPSEAGGAAGFEDISAWRESFVHAFVELSKLGTGPGGSGALNPDLGRAEALPLFLAGRAPFLVCSSRALASIKDKRMDVTVAAVPPLGDRPAVSMVSVYGFYIYRDAPNIPAARDLVTSYLSQPDAGEDLNRLQQLVPVQEEAMDTVAARDAVLRPYIGQCDDGQVMPSWPEMRDAWRLLGQTEYKVLAGGSDPRAVAGEAAEAGWELLREARASGQ
ncbi:sugar ABC transporter substrate-binding protein [Streptomyces sp. MAR4 CNX-425]|uniref:sugar ABC transporter substrate-binding protein n=1 Tax=Streptomyces sp. MAR4 CNX-425 TaxID=3406343 RepID=UPI003B5097E4